MVSVITRNISNKPFMLSVILLNVVMQNVVILSVVMLSVVMLSVVMLNFIMLSVIMLNVIMLSVVMLSVVAPKLSISIPISFASLKFKMSEQARSSSKLDRFILASLVFISDTD